MSEKKLEPNEYRCDACRGVFNKGWTEEEARAEAQALFQQQARYARHGASLRRLLARDDGPAASCSGQAGTTMSEGEMEQDRSKFIASEEVSEPDRALHYHVVVLRDDQVQKIADAVIARLRELPGAQ